MIEQPSAQTGADLPCGVGGVKKDQTRHRSQRIQEGQHFPRILERGLARHDFDRQGFRRLLQNLQCRPMAGAGLIPGKMNFHPAGDKHHLGGSRRGRPGNQLAQNLVQNPGGRQRNLTPGPGFTRAGARHGSILLLPGREHYTPWDKN